MTREPIYAALFAQLVAATGIIRSSRRLPPWSEVAQGDSPALFQIQKTEAAEHKYGLPTKWSAQVEVYVYVSVGDQVGAVASSQLNPILDAIEKSLAPDASGNNTLGGLVSHCWIGPSIETDEGVLGDQAIAIIPINIVVAP